MISIAEFARRLERVDAEMHAVVPLMLRVIGEEGERIAKRKIGHRQPGWAELAPSTVEDKASLGFGPPDFQPLERTRQMQASIGHSVAGPVLTLGATDKVMLFHEFGSRNIPAGSYNPPRPVIGPTMMELEATVQAMGGRVVTRILMGGRADLAIVRVRR